MQKTMNRCLYCYQPLHDGETNYHKVCSKKFFGQDIAPVLPYAEKDMDNLADQLGLALQDAAGEFPTLMSSEPADAEELRRELRVLLEQGPLEPRQIVQLCRISSPSLAGVLARMDELGLVTRQRLHHDQLRRGQRLRRRDGPRLLRVERGLRQWRCLHQRHLRAGRLRVRARRRADRPRRLRPHHARGPRAEGGACALSTLPGGCGAARRYAGARGCRGGRRHSATVCAEAVRARSRWRLAIL